MGAQNEVPPSHRKGRWVGDTFHSLGWLEKYGLFGVPVGFAGLQPYLEVMSHECNSIHNRQAVSSTSTDCTRTNAFLFPNLSAEASLSSSLQAFARHPSSQAIYYKTVNPGVEEQVEFIAKARFQSFSWSPLHPYRSIC